MKTYDILGYSFSAIKLRKLRAALTTLGVIIGIAAIVALLSITQGLQVSITNDLNRGLSSNTLIVVTGSNALGAVGGTNEFGGGVGGGRVGRTTGTSGVIGGSGAASSGFALDINSTSEIDALSPLITSSMAVIDRAGFVDADGLNSSATFYGVDFNQYAMHYSTTFIAASGTVPTNPTNNDIVVGARIVDPQENGTKLFNVGDNVGIIWTNATTFTTTGLIVNETYSAQVTGVLQKEGGFGFGGPSDNGVYIPLSQAESFFGTSQCDYIIVTLRDSSNATITSVSKLITDHFDGQVTVISSTAVLSLLSTIFGTIQLFLGGIAAISLLVAGIGIMNIMIVSLIERTREIGILKALGMKSRTVLSVFLGESAIIGVMGAFLGILAGWILANITSRLLATGAFGGTGFKVTPLLTPEVFAGSLVFGIGISIIFAMYPAWRASKLKPVDALRYE